MKKFEFKKYLVIKTNLISFNTIYAHFIAGKKFSNLINTKNTFSNLKSQVKEDYEKILKK